MADMENGVFSRDNTETPKGDRVLPLFSLKSRTAMVSEAGAGIGLAVAQAFAETGANVAIWYNSNKQALAEADKIEKTYGVKCRLDGRGLRGEHAIDERARQARHTKSTCCRPRPSTRPSAPSSRSSTAASTSSSPTRESPGRMGP